MMRIHGEDFVAMEAKCHRACYRRYRAAASSSKSTGHDNFMRNSFTYKCAQLWNKLPEDVKLADNVDIFKAKLKLIQL